jgi:hypothetical protein
VVRRALRRDYPQELPREVVTTGVSITAVNPAVGSGVEGKPLETSAIGCTETVDAGNRIAIHLTRNYASLSAQHVPFATLTS